MEGKLATYLVFISLLSVPGLHAQDFQKTVLPFLKQNCFACHNDKLRTGNFSLEVLRDENTGLKRTADWVKVLDKLSAGKMPPSTMPAPPKADIAAVTVWIEKLLGSSTADSDPGRVTTRRLNRNEYNNTIHDLLGVSLRPGDAFPVDDSGYGFDNIGDVLSLSPMLMEKYIAAARTISRVAVFGEPYPANPAKLIRILPKKFQDDTVAGGNITPFSMRGALYASFDFPVDAEYEFRVRLANYRALDRYGPAAKVDDTPARPRVSRRAVTEVDRKAMEEAARKAFPPVQMLLRLDGRFILTDLVEGSVDYKYARGESVVRVPVKAGRHLLRASFPELADLVDPRTNVNGDGRRKLYVDYMDIIGPYHPVAGPPESYKRILICGHLHGNHQPDCARRIVGNLARHAYRGPVTEAETDELMRLVSIVSKEKDSFDEGIRVALQAILMSPNFLFRIERDPGPGIRRINEYEFASRLSYFLWSSMPDEELFRAAAAKTLFQPDVLGAQLQRMVRDPKANALVENFGGQWLNLRQLDRKKPDAGRFPAVDDELLDAMRRETNLFMAAVVREDRSILDLIDGKFTFVNGPLARYYGIGGVNGEEFQRVALDGEQRSGILTQASILTLSSYATRTSPVLRGKWVLETLLGSPPPAPPADVPALEESGLGSNASMRQKLEQHRANPSCAVCHSQMDPIGFGLENFDAAGGWRLQDGNFPVDSFGVLPNGRSFHGSKELKEILRNQTDLFTRNLTEKLLTYALGRGLEPSDRRTIDEISRAVAAKHHRFSALLLEIASSRPFQMQRGRGDNHESQ
jgi:hypothetical protein